MMALKTLQELENYHYMQNTGFHKIYVTAMELERQTFNLEDDVFNLIQRVDELEHFIKEKAYE